MWLGMFYGPSRQPSPGSLEEIVVPISEMYCAIRVPFGDHKCYVFPKSPCKMPSFFVPFVTFYVVRSSPM